MALLYAGLAAAVLVLCGWMGRMLLAGKIPTKIFFAIWKLAVLRLLLPVPLPVYYESSQSRTALQAGAMPELEKLSSFSRELPAAAKEPDLLKWIILGVWAAGAVGIAAFLLARHLRWRKIYREALPLSMSCQGIPAYESLRVCQSGWIPGPLTYGAFRPVILLPAGLEPWILPYVLAHEAVHVRRRDNLFQWLFLAAFCLHWMNPMVWALGYFFSRDMERSCDEEAVEELGMSRRGAYARALLAAAEQAGNTVPFAAGFGKHPIKERVENVMKMTMKKRVFLAACLIAAAGVLTAVVSVDLKAVNPVTAEGDSSLSEEMENSTVALWKNTKPTEQNLMDAKALAEFAMEVYKVSETGSVGENPSVKAAVQDGTLDDEVLAALSQQHTEQSEHLLLTIAAGDVMPGLYQMSNSAAKTPAEEMAGLLFQAFADSMKER